MPARGPYLLPAMLLLLSLACQSQEEIRQSGCQSCHRPADAEGLGIEIPHARFALRCEDCHGGDPGKTTIEEAHVPNPAMVQVVEGLSADELTRLDADYLRFLSPAHPGAVNASCGSGSPQAAAGAGCHQSLVDTMKLSTHATSVGLVNIPRFERGILAGRPPAKAVLTTRNPSFQSSNAPRFTYAGLDALTLNTLDMADPSDPRDYADNFQSKQCGQCHLHGYGGGVQPGGDGLYRGVGCASCHMPYGHDGLSQSDGPLIDKTTPSHAEKHVLTRSPPDRACETCHNRSNRVGLQFKGWREAADGEQASLPGAQFTSTPQYGRPAGSYVLDEDTSNDFDETPPDVHQAMGMQCVDCHVGVDVHGDGSIRPNMGAEVGIECVDCHGTFSAPIAEDDGVFRSTGGSRLERLVRTETGIMLNLVSGTQASVTQIVDLQQTPTVVGAHDADAHGALECYACHTVWMQNVLQTEQLLDLRGAAVDPVVGQSTPGVPSERIVQSTLSAYLLGVNVDGQIGPFLAEHSPFTVIAPCDPRTDTATCTEDMGSATPGKRIVDQWLGASSEGRIGLSFRPVVPHTVGAANAVRSCVDCHPTADGLNLAQVRAVYGFGTGEFMFTEPATGRTVDLLRMIDDAGTSTSAMGTLLARPLQPERIQAAIDTTVQ